jgi:hypothetical protein
MNQETAAPTNKVAAAGIGGSLSIILIYLVGLTGVQLPPEVASAITALVAFLSGYLKTESK